MSVKRQLTVKDDYAIGGAKKGLLDLKITGDSPVRHLVPDFIIILYEKFNTFRYHLMNLKPFLNHFYLLKLKKKKIQ